MSDDQILQQALCRSWRNPLRKKLRKHHERHAPKHAEIRVAHLEGMVCIRIKGRATVRSSVPFKRFMLEQLDLGHRSFVIELSQCLVWTDVSGCFGFACSATPEADAASAHLD